MENSEIYKRVDTLRLGSPTLNHIAKFNSITKFAKTTDIGEFSVYEYPDGSVYYFKGLREFSKDEFENYLLKERLKNIKNL